MKPFIHLIAIVGILAFAACSGDNGTSATGIGNPGTYTITANRVEITAINDQQILVQADQGFLKLASDLSLSDTTIVLKTNGETSLVLIASDFDESQGHPFFSITVPGSAGDTISVDVTVFGASTDDKRVEATATGTGATASNATLEPSSVANTGTQIVDALCERVHGCHSEIPEAACAEGIRLTSTLSDEFGVTSDTSFFFSELIASLESGTLTVVDADPCLSDIAALSCTTLDTGFDINNPKMYENTETIIPDSCGTLFAGTAATDRTVNALSTLVDQVCVPISFCGAISAKTCDEGLRLVTNLADNLGLSSTLSVEDMIAQVETGALVVNESTLDTCKTQLETLRLESASDCEVYENAYSPNNPTNFNNLEEALACPNLLTEGGSSGQ